MKVLVQNNGKVLKIERIALTPLAGGALYYGSIKTNVKRPDWVDCTSDDGTQTIYIISFMNWTTPPVTHVHFLPETEQEHALFAKSHLLRLGGKYGAYFYIVPQFDDYDPSSVVMFEEELPHSTAQE